MKVAKAKGRLRGKQPKLKPRQEAHLVAMHRTGEHTSAELAELFNVARSTVYRSLERARQTAAATDATAQRVVATTRGKSVSRPVMRTASARAQP